MKVKELYDQLGILENRISKKESYPIHKKLIFEKEGYNDLNDWLVDTIVLNENISVLDAGCGTGQTLFKIAEKQRVVGLGISLSDVEIDFAKSFRVKNNYPDLDFKVSSFDENLSQKFDLIIAIESIKHSSDYKNSIRNLANHLNPGGEFWLIEDIRIAELNKLSNTNKFKEWWNVPFLFDQKEIEESGKYAGLKLKKIYDLTSKMNRPSLLKAKRRFRIWNALRYFTFGKKIRNNIRTFLAGFILDQWYLNKQMSYLVFRFQKEEGTD